MEGAGPALGPSFFRPVKVCGEQAFEKDQSFMHAERRHVMKRRLGFVLLSFAFSHALSAAFWTQLHAGAQSQGASRPATTQQDDRQQREPQPGARQGGVLTSETDAQAKFNMDYFVGQWNFEASVSESPLGAGGPMSGSEIVRNVWDGRFWDITIKGEDADGPFTGKGIIIYQDSFAGQSYTKYEITRGIAVLRTGTLGCDLGGTCNLHFETPPFEHNGSRIQLRGRYYLTSPFAYRVTTEISVDKGEYRNWGTVRYTKDEKAKPPAIK
jgi:hypothetical protein